MGKAARNKKKRKMKKISLTEYGARIRSGRYDVECGGLPRDVLEALESAPISVYDKLTQTGKGSSCFAVFHTKDGKINCLMDTDQALLMGGRQLSVSLPEKLAEYSFALETDLGDSTLVRVYKDGGSVYIDLDVETLRLHRLAAGVECNLVSMVAKFAIFQAEEA